MISGHVDLSYITPDMLAATKFDECNEVSDSNGLWEELGIDNPPYHTGSTVVHQAFDKSCPIWVNKIKNQFDWVTHGTVTLNKLTPGNYIPPHADTLYRFKQYLKDNDLDINGSEPVRVNIFLQNKEIGHFLDIANQAVSNYSKGDYVLIRPGVIHTVANLGYTDRYTMQITGIIKKES